MHDKKSGGLLAGGCLILGAVLALLLSKLSLGGVARLILRAALIAAIAVALLVIVVLVFALRSSKEERKETQKTELSKDNEALLAKGRSNLAQLRAMSARIRSAAIRGKANGICASADRSCALCATIRATFPASGPFSTTICQRSARSSRNTSIWSAAVHRWRK